MQDMVIPADEVEAMRGAVEIIVDLAQRTLDACTDLGEALGHQYSDNSREGGM